MTMIKKALTYDDVLLVPRYSEIRSRKEIDISNKLDENITLRLPIIASPMDTVSGFEMASYLSKAGAMAIIHRYMSVVDQTQTVSDLKRL